VEFLPLDLSTGGRPLFEPRPTVAGSTVHEFEPAQSGTGAGPEAVSEDRPETLGVGDNFRIIEDKVARFEDVLAGGARGRSAQMSGTLALGVITCSAVDYEGH
jgi:hypothetical protein